MQNFVAIPPGFSFPHMHETAHQNVYSGFFGGKFQRATAYTPTGVWGSAVSSPSGVRGGPPAEIEFDAL